MRHALLAAAVLAVFGFLPGPDAAGADDDLVATAAFRKLSATSANGAYVGALGFTIEMWKGGAITPTPGTWTYEEIVVTGGGTVPERTKAHTYAYTWTGVVDRVTEPAGGGDPSVYGEIDYDLRHDWTVGYDFDQLGWTQQEIDEYLAGQGAENQPGPHTMDDAWKGNFYALVKIDPNVGRCFPALEGNPCFGFTEIAGGGGGPGDLEPPKGFRAWGHATKPVVSLDWEKAEDAEEIRIERREAAPVGAKALEGDWKGIANLPGKKTKFGNKLVTPDTVYEYRIQQRTEAGWSDWSDPQRAWTAQKPPKKIEWDLFTGRWHYEVRETGWLTCTPSGGEHLLAGYLPLYICPFKPTDCYPGTLSGRITAKGSRAKGFLIAAFEVIGPEHIEYRTRFTFLTLLPFTGNYETFFSQATRADQDDFETAGLSHTVADRLDPDPRPAPCRLTTAWKGKKMKRPRTGTTFTFQCQVHCLGPSALTGGRVALEIDTDGLRLDAVTPRGEAQVSDTGATFADLVLPDRGPAHGKKGHIELVDLTVTVTAPAGAEASVTARFVPMLTIAPYPELEFQPASRTLEIPIAR